MFLHNFKYSLKVLLKSRMLLFWTFAFPILLSLFFNMAFSDIENNEKLDVIDIVVVSNDNYNNDIFLQESFKELSNDESENKIFNITYTSLDEATQLLSDKEITGYVVFEDIVKITVNANGINETVFRTVVDEINSNKNIIEALNELQIEEEHKNGNYNINYEEIYMNSISKTLGTYITLNNTTRDNLSYTMIEYYTLIAMACLYGAMISMHIINYKLANMNSVGMRTSISPIHKGKMLLGSLFASYIVQLVGIALLFIFSMVVLRADYGSNLPLIIVLACMGSLAGLSMGVAVASLIKSNENVKTGVLLAITMTGCFLSGMFGITMKYVIDKNIPIINQLNPASMITDGLYSLYYYDTLNRYIFNIVSLFLFSLVMIVISYRGLRRQKYDSI